MIEGIEAGQVFKQPFESQHILVSRDVHPIDNRRAILSESQTRRSWHAALDARFQRLVFLRGTWSQACSNRVRGGCPRSVDG